MNAGEKRDAIDRLLARRTDFVDFAAARMDSRSAAEDLVQEALARALERIDHLRAADAVLGWFYALLRNALTDHHRRRASSARLVERLAGEPDAADPVERRPCRCVARLAAELKPEYAQALQRVAVDGAPLAELAGELGITAGNAAVRLHRARAALRRDVLATCRDCAESGCTDCTCAAPPAP